MGIEIRNAAPEEYQAAIDVMSTGFLERPDVRAVAEAVADTWEPSRTWVAFDGDRACGTFRSWPTRLTVPGGAELPASAVSGVTVLPSHRRRGILTGMAAREHAALVERGECIGLLYASEYPIYGRFGYAPGTRAADWVITTRATGMLGVADGTVELAVPDETTREILKGVFEAWRPRQAGEISLRDVTWDSRLGLLDEPWGERWKGWVLLHRDASGAVDGYARYKAIPKWAGHAPQAVVEVQELQALTPGAYAGLVRFLLELDLVATVKLEGRRVSEPVRWLLTNARAAQQTDARRCPLGPPVRCSPRPRGAHVRAEREPGPRGRRRGRLGRCPPPAARRHARRGHVSHHRSVAGPHAAGRGARRRLPRWDAAP